MRTSSKLWAASLIVLAASAAHLTSFAAPTAANAAEPAAQSGDAEAANAQLLALFAKSDEDTLNNGPIEAMFRGDMRGAEQFGDYITDSYYHQQREQVAAKEAEISELQQNVQTTADALGHAHLELAAMKGEEA